jgi:O-antigen/teichoic acid export membrane protein
MIKNNNNKQSIIWSLVTTLSISISPAITFIIISTLHGVATLGVFSWAFQTWLLLILFSSYGNQQAAIILAAKKHNQDISLWKTGINSSLRMGTYYCAVSIIISFIIWTTGGDPRSLLVATLSLSLPAACIGRFLQGYLAGKRNIDLLGKIILIKTTITLILTWQLLLITDSLVYLCLMLSAIEWLSLIALLHSSKPGGSYQHPEAHDDYKNSLKYYGWNSIVSEATNRVDILIIGLFASLENTGIYSLISTFGRIPLLVSQSYYRILMPEVSRNPPAAGIQTSFRLINKSMKDIGLLLFSGVLLIVIAIVILPEILPTLELTSTLISLFVLFYLISSAQAIYGCIGITFLCWSKPNVQLIRQSILLCMVSLLVFIGIFFFGLSEAIYGLALAYLTHILLMPVFFKYAFNRRLDLMLLLKALLFLLPTLGGLMLIHLIFPLVELV